MKIFPKPALATAIMLCAGAAITTSRASPQGTLLRDKLIGTWTITSVRNQYDDGKSVSPFGAGVTGRYYFGSDGLFSETIIGEPRADLKTDDPRRPDAFTVINLGHFTVDEAHKSISYKIDRAGYAARNGGERTLTATLSGDTATFVTAKITDQFGTFAFQADVTRAR
jgi:hypothetical protein